MKCLVIGTGFLGRAVCDLLLQGGETSLHTFCSHQYFDDSIQFDLFSQRLGHVLDLDDIDVVVVTSKIENNPNTREVTMAMGRLFDDCANQRVVYISSDAVFDGTRGMYREDDERNPVTLYGRNKVLCENLLQERVFNHCILRTSYIYGFSLRQLDNRLGTAKEIAENCQPIRKFVDMFKSPVEVNQLANIILAVGRANFRGALHACGTRISVYDFYRSSLEVLGVDTTYLLADRIPHNPPPDYLVDSSLDSGMLYKLFGMNPLSIIDALTETANGNGTSQ